ncbi:glycosyltransferase [Fodinicurvata halophila]
MRILVVTDAWAPQVNGVVRTFTRIREELHSRGHLVEVISPEGFRSLPCPGYPEIPLVVRPGRQLVRRIEAFAPEAIHIATEGLLGSPPAVTACGAACRSPAATPHAFPNTFRPACRCRCPGAMPSCGISIGRLARSWCPRTASGRS